MKKLIFIFGLAALVLFSCEKQKDSRQSSTASQAAAGTDSSAVKPVSDDAPQAPAWYQRLPQKEGMLYAAAKGRSLRPNMARNKAVMQAQKQLAAQVEALNQPDSLKIKTGGGAQAAEQENGGVLLTKAIIKNQKQVKKGKYWYVFVLMEMPVSAR